MNAIGKLAMNTTEKVKAQLVIVTGLLVLYFVFKSVWLLYAAVAVGVVSLAIPVIGDFLVRMWFKLAEVLGAVNGKIILSLLFYVFLFPIAVLYRLSTKNPLAVKRSAEKSMYAERNHTYTKDDLEHTW
ncbi:hypothetical protein GCM10023187_31070 [Nibrella viscosa]|uniref:Uncharacterized protein n=1 Tax=Nibrella viscosa TaxID=1084524 RepID=A0ABP8KKR1_9BACT